MKAHILFLHPDLDLSDLGLFKVFQDKELVNEDEEEYIIVENVSPRFREYAMPTSNRHNFEKEEKPILNET